MRKPSIPIMIMVAAHLGLALMLSVFVFSSYALSSPMAQNIISSVVALEQISLLALWLAIGRWHGPCRLVCLVCGILVWAYIICYHFLQPDDMAYLECLLIIQALFTIVPIGIARFFGLKIIAPPSTSPEDPDELQKLPGQYSLARLFAWTTSLAICFGLSRWSIGGEQSYDRFSNILRVYPFFIAITTMAYLSLWLILGTRWPHVRFIGFFVSLFAISWLAPGPGANEPFEKILFYSSLAILFTLSFLAIRIAGFRLTFQRKRRPKKQPIDET